MLTAESDAVHVDALVLELPVVEGHDLLNEYVPRRRHRLRVARRTAGKGETERGINEWLL